MWVWRGADVRFDWPGVLISGRTHEFSPPFRSVEQSAWKPLLPCRTHKARLMGWFVLLSAGIFVPGVGLHSFYPPCQGYSIQSGTELHVAEYDTPWIWICRWDRSREPGMWEHRLLQKHQPPPPPHPRFKMQWEIKYDSSLCTTPGCLVLSVFAQCFLCSWENLRFFKSMEALIWAPKLYHIILFFRLEIKSVRTTLAAPLFIFNFIPQQLFYSSRGKISFWIWLGFKAWALYIHKPSMLFKEGSKLPCCGPFTY